MITKVEVSQKKLWCRSVRAVRHRWHSAPVPKCPWGTLRHWFVWDIWHHYTDRFFSFV